MILFLFSNFLFLTAASAGQDAQKPAASLSPLKINTSISKGSRSLLKRLDIAKRLREAIVDSGLFAIYSRDSEELKQSLQRERELAESGLAKQDEAINYSYQLTSYFFSPEVVSFTAYSTYSSVPFVKGIYDRRDIASIIIRLAVLGSDGEVLFEESGKDSFNSGKYEYESKTPPKGGHPSFSNLEKMADRSIHKLLNAIDARVNPITIYDRYKDVVLLNRGKNNGFKKGTRMIVFSPPKEWTNPNTGVTHRMPGRQVGEIEIIRIEEEHSEAKIIKENKKIAVNFILRIK